MSARPPLVLVTGAGGFVGGHVARLLAISGEHRVRGFVRRTPGALPGDPEIEWVVGDLRDPRARSKALTGASAVIHCASWVRLGADPLGLSRAVNVEATRALLEEARRAGVGRFVYTSTLQTIASGTPDRPADEDAAWNLDTVRSPYTETKREAESLVVSASDARMSTVALCPGMAVGPRDPGPTSTRVLLLMSRSNVAVLPAGGIPLVDVRVLARAHVAALSAGGSGRRLAVVGPYVSFREQARLVAEVCGRPKGILPIPDLAERAISRGAGWIDRAARGRWVSISRAVVAGGFLRFHVDGSRADAAFGLEHPPPIRSIHDTLDDARRFGRAPWLIGVSLEPGPSESPEPEAQSSKASTRS